MLPSKSALAAVQADTITVTVALSGKHVDYLRRLAEAAVIEAGQDLEYWRALRGLFSGGPIAADLGIVLQEPTAPEARRAH